jgi:hypothetical protein
MGKNVEVGRQGSLRLPSEVWSRYLPDKTQVSTAIFWNFIPKIRLYSYHDLKLHGA